MRADGDLLVIDKVSAAEDVRQIVAFLRTSWRSRRWLNLDFETVGERSAERINTRWAEVLANALLAEFGSARLEVRLPASEVGQVAFARSGLLFAIWQRPAELTRVEDASRPPWAGREMWARNWRPADAEFRRTLFSANRATPDEVVPGEFATFLNPHLAVDDADLVAELADQQAMPWVEHLIAKASLGLDLKARQDLISAVSQISTELILNIGHAFRRHTGPTGDVTPRNQRCYVQVYVTEGGGQESHNRLHVVVSDVGHGVLRTLRPKLVVLDKDFSSMAPTEIISRLLNDDLPSFGRASGLGYKQIVDTVAQHEGRLTLTTGSRGETAGLTVMAELDASAGGRGLTVGAEPTLGFLGTAAHAVIPMQPRPRPKGSG